MGRYAFYEKHNSLPGTQTALKPRLTGLIFLMGVSIYLFVYSFIYLFVSLFLFLFILFIYFFLYFSILFMCI